MTIRLVIFGCRKVYYQNAKCCVESLRRYKKPVNSSHKASLEHQDGDDRPPPDYKSDLE